MTSRSRDILASKRPRTPASQRSGGLPTPIRVAHIVYTMGTGGLEKGVATIVRHASPGFEHVVLCLAHSGPSERLLPAGTPVVEFRKPSGNSLRFIWRVAREIRRLRPHVVHTRNWSALDGLIAARLAGVRNIVHGEHGWGVDDPDGLNPKRIRVRRFLSRWVREYTCVSAAMVPWLEHTVRVGRPVTQIYNGVDPDVFRPGPGGRVQEELGTPPGAFVAGIVGRLDPIKDHPTLLRAFARVRERHPDAVLLVVGDGPERESLERAAGDGVRFLGNRLDAPDVLRALDVFVLSSRNEGISNTILEAMATGLPVVATRTGGNPELVVDGSTGRLVPVGDVTAFADRLLAYLADPDLRRAHGAAGRERVLERFTIERMVASYETVYQRVAGLAAGDSRERVRETARASEPSPGCDPAVRTPEVVDARRRVSQGGLLGGTTAKQAAKVLVARGALLCGAGCALRWWNRHKVLVLMYHGVTEFAHDPPRWTQLPAGLFLEQVRWLRDRYQVISLDAFRDGLEGRSRIPERAALITFDDGLRNNATVAFPILRDLGLPATVFLTTSLVGTDRLLWFDRLYLQIKAVARGQAESGVLQGAFGRRITLDNLSAAYRKVGGWVMHLPLEERQAFLEQIDREVPLAWGPEAADYRLMTWEQARSLRESGLFSFGAHTATHQVLSSLTDDELETELGGTAVEMERSLGAPVWAFAYPNGRSGADFTAEHGERLKALGFGCAFATDPGVYPLLRGGDPMAVPRVGVGDDLTSHPAYFKLMVSCGGPLRKLFCGAG